MGGRPNREGIYVFWASQVALGVKNLPANAGDIRDLGSIPGWRRSPGGEYGNLFQCSCLENPMDKETWQATVHGITRVRHDLALFLSFLIGTGRHRKE